MSVCHKTALLNKNTQRPVNMKRSEGELATRRESGRRGSEIGMEGGGKAGERRGKTGKRVKGRFGEGKE